MKTVEEMLLSQVVYNKMEVITEGVPDDNKSKFLAPVKYMNKYELNRLQSRTFSDMRNILNTFNYGDIELFFVDERSDQLFRPLIKVTSTKLSRKIFKRYEPTSFGYILNNSYANALLLLSSQIGKALSEIFEDMIVNKIMHEHGDKYTKSMVLTYTFKKGEDEEKLFARVKEIMSSNLRNFGLELKFTFTEASMNYRFEVTISLQKTIEILRCGILKDCDMTLQLNAENDELEQAVYRMMYDEEPSEKYFANKVTTKVPVAESFEDMF